MLRSPEKNAKSGLFYMKSEVDGVEVTAFRIWIAEECARGRRGDVTC